jgi:2-methylcitrate dehydratase PrpD
MTLVDELAARLLAKAREDDPAAEAAAKSRLLHAVGVALASGSLPAPALAWATVSGDEGACTVVGRPHRLLDRSAAFCNAVAIHGSLLEDCGPGGLRGGSHPGTYVLPAALAAAESVGAGGPELLKAIVVGYEAVGRLGAIAPTEIVRRGFRPVPLAGPFGAATAAIVLLGGGEPQMRAAIGLAANVGGGINQGFLDGTMEPYLHAGFAASNGLLAAKLAAAGAVTSDLALEGPRGFFATYGGDEAAVGVLADPPEPNVVAVGVKRFPSCVQNQATMALALERGEGPVAIEEIERIVLRRPRDGANGLNSPGVEREPPYENMLQAQMSARFTAAAALLDRPVERTAYFMDNYADGDVARLAAKIDLEAGEDDSVTLTIEGRGPTPIVLHEAESQVLRPTAEVVRERFIGRAEPLLGDRAAQTADLIDRLETVQELTQLTELIELPEGA